MIPVAVVASAQTKHERRKADQNVEEMIFRTVTELLNATGIDIKDIDTVISASDDVLDGRSISNVFTVEAMGGFLKEESKVEEDGAYAALYAYMRLLTGAFDSALVVGYSKASDSSPQTYSGMIFDPFYQRPLGLEAISASALQARRYMDRYGITETQAAKVAVKNRRNAQRNPYAQIRKEMTVDEVLNSPPLATPIKKLDASPISDGCCALLLASEKRAKDWAKTPAWIHGVGYCSDAYYLGYRDLAEAASARAAAEKAYAMAGIKDPAREINVAEIYEAFSFHELMLYEALGLCGPGEGGNLVDSGKTEQDGALPVNPSGGALSANPLFATGLIRLAEAAAQVSGAAGERQIDGVHTAVAHSTSGLCLQSNIVYLLRKT